MPTLMCSSKNLLNSQLAWHLYQNQTSFLIDYLTYKNEKGWIEWNIFHEWLLKLKEIKEIKEIKELKELIENAIVIEQIINQNKTN